jgi:SOS-response transcriptional repressor LexA
MTPKQRELVGTIQRLTVDGVSPTFDDLRVALGRASKAPLHAMIHRLVAKGVLTIEAGKRRSLVVRNIDVEGVPFDQMARAVCALPDGKRSFADIRDALVAAYSRGDA